MSHTEREEWKDIFKILFGQLTHCCLLQKQYHLLGHRWINFATHYPVPKQGHTKHAQDKVFVDYTVESFKKKKTKGLNQYVASNYSLDSFYIFTAYKIQQYISNNKKSLKKNQSKLI